MTTVQQELQLKLRERYRRLLLSDHGSFALNARLALEFLRRNRRVSAILAGLESDEPELDVDGWSRQLTTHGSRFVGWPCRTEQGKARLSLAALTLAAETENITGLVHHFSSNNNLDDMTRGFVEAMVAPLYEFLDETIVEESTIVYALERYVRVLEWFDRDKLLRQYEGDTQNGEGYYDRHFRRFLFTEGFDMPFSQVRGPSGDSDALINLETDDPLIAELKVFDPERSKRVPNIASAVHQALSYAQDHGKSVAYAVIINLSGQPLNLPSDDEQRNWPPYVDLAGVRVFLVAVRGRRLASASELRRANATTVTRVQLVSEASQGEGTTSSGPKGGD